VLIDHGDATPNDLEILSHSSNISHNSSIASKQQMQQQGRSPLYWASFCGHTELVRELIARGGVDTDGSAYIAVTGRERADDNRDLYFDPDEGIFSDGINYSSSQLETALSSVTANTTEQDPVSDKGDQDTYTSSKKKIKTASVDDRTLIRTMLIMAKTENQDDAYLKGFPIKLSRSSSTISTACSFTSQASAATQTSAAASNSTQQQQQQQANTTVIQSVASLVSIPEACSTSVASSPSTISTTFNRSTSTCSNRSCSSTHSSVKMIRSKSMPAVNTASTTTPTRTINRSTGSTTSTHSGVKMIRSKSTTPTINRSTGSTTGTHRSVKMIRSKSTPAVNTTINRSTGSTTSTHNSVKMIRCKSTPADNTVATTIPSINRSTGSTTNTHSSVKMIRSKSTPADNAVSTTIPTINRSTGSTSSTHSSVMMIRSKSTSADNTAECIICFNADQPLSICVPCGHISSCKVCLEMAQKNCTGCPLCQERIMVRVALDVE
jgi:Zinc finger, C3HC4 type (RING finger)